MHHLFDFHRISPGTRLSHPDIVRYPSDMSYPRIALIKIKVSVIRKVVMVTEKLARPVGICPHPNALASFAVRLPLMNGQNVHHAEQRATPTAAIASNAMVSGRFSPDGKSGRIRSD
jgi:hypothetical protein